MAVYTHLGAEALAELVATYDVGALVSAKGIAEGVSNSNWLIETSGRDGNGARFILTMYERRIDVAELPFFLGLLDHLSGKGCPVPRTIHDRTGAASQVVDDKAVALIEFLPGVSPTTPTPAQANSVGAALAATHLAALDYPHSRTNPLDVRYNAEALASRSLEDLQSIHPALPTLVDTARLLVQQWPDGLPASVIHSDLFPDNVLMLGDTGAGMIDFYSSTILNIY